MSIRSSTCWGRSAGRSPTFAFAIDTWRHQGEIEKEVAAVLPRLDTYEAEGTLWARTSAYGDDKDRPLVRSADGSYLYFAADVAYVRDKLERGFDRAIYVLGADHHGYVGRLKAAAAMLGYDPERIEVLIYQLVHIVEGGETKKISKRRGDVVFLHELVEKIGIDAARWYLVSRGHDQPLDIDVDLATERTPKNPVYYVQYAHARIAGILRNAEAANAGVDVPKELEREERDLIKRLAEFPVVAAEAAERRSPHAVPDLRDPGRGRLSPLLPRASRGGLRDGGVPVGARPRDAKRDRAGSRPGRGRGARTDVGSRPRMSARPPDRNLALELVRVTESAALAAGRWVGRGDKIAADQAAVDGMRAMLDSVSMAGVVVIGEGEKDEAPMLFNGEPVGDGTGPEVDVAVDPLEGTRLTALGQPNAIAVIAVAERGTMFFPGAAVYMNKIAVGPQGIDAVDIDASPTENVERRREGEGSVDTGDHGGRARA